MRHVKSISLRRDTYRSYLEKLEARYGEASGIKEQDLADEIEILKARIEELSWVLGSEEIN